MPSRLGKRKDYNLVDDAYDSRVPLHNEDAFRHGITFKAKYIGTLDVPRPTGRMEIVVAMRRIRYEFKAKSVKKRKVNIKVSTDGVRVVLRKKKKKKEWSWDINRMLIMHDPIYRIFYVSHDSHDLKIWSYIARDGSSNVFRCNVFKSPKKSLAMHIVRTVGQAFEVCHKLNIGPPPKRDDKLAIKDKKVVETADKKPKDEVDNGKVASGDGTPMANGELDVKLSKSLSADGKPPIASKDTLLLQSVSEPISIQAIDSKTPLSVHHQLQLSQQKILQAEQQTEVAVAQVHLLKDQLAAETTARIEAQARNHQLLTQNRELLEQMSDLVAKLSEVEAKFSNIESDRQLSITLGKVVVDGTTPRSDVANNPILGGAEFTKVSPFVDTSLFENTNANSGNAPVSDLSKLANGLTDIVNASDSTITKSSLGSGSIRAKASKIDDDVSGSSSDSSSEDEGVGRAVRLANESGTVKNVALDTDVPLANGNVPADQTADTSVWTSGLVTPERILGGQSYQQSALTFNDTSLSATVNDSNLSNSYTLSPIFTVGTGPETTGNFQHFSITEADDSLKLPETPTGATVKKVIKKSLSASTELKSKENTVPPTSYSSMDLGNHRHLFRAGNVSEDDNPWEDSFNSQLHESSNKSSDLHATPRLNPPPTHGRRSQLPRMQPEYRPRPDVSSNQSPPDVSRSPISRPIVSPKLVDTSDSDMEIPPKLPKYNNNGVKISQSSYSYGSDPLLSRFDPLLLKSKSFDHASPGLPDKPNTVLSPVQDLGHSNPFLNNSENLKNPSPQDVFSKSYSNLERPKMQLFVSQQEYEAKLRYEPLRKQQASEWQHRLNSSFHAGDQAKKSSPSTTKDKIPAYRTYNDLPATVTPVKNLAANSIKVRNDIKVESAVSFNTNNNNSVKFHTSKHNPSLFQDPPSVDSNIFLLDDLFISENDDKLFQIDEIPAEIEDTTPKLSQSDHNTTLGLSDLGLHPDEGSRELDNAELPEPGLSGDEIRFSDSKSLLESIESMIPISKSSIINRELTNPGLSAREACHDGSILEGIGEMMTVADNHPTSVGSNSDSGLSGCGGVKLEQSTSVLSDYPEHH